MNSFELCSFEGISFKLFSFEEIIIELFSFEKMSIGLFIVAAYSYSTQRQIPSGTFAN